MTSTVPQDLLHELGLDHLSPPAQAEALQSMGKIIFENVMLAVMTVMDEQTQAELERLVERNPSPEELEAFLMERVPEYPRIVEREVKTFREDALRVMRRAA